MNPQILVCRCLWCHILYQVVLVAVCVWHCWWVWRLFSFLCLWILLWSLLLSCQSVWRGPIAFFCLHGVLFPHPSLAIGNVIPLTFILLLSFLMAFLWKLFSMRCSVLWCGYLFLVFLCLLAFCLLCGAYIYMPPFFVCGIHRVTMGFGLTVDVYMDMVLILI